MAYVSYFEKYKKYYDSLFGQEGIVGKSQALSNDVSNRINIIKNSYFNMINESKWQELGKNIVATQIISGLKSEINKLNIFIKNNLCQACDLSINTVLANLEIIKVEDENLKKMYDDLELLMDEYNHTPEYFEHWRDEKKPRGEVISVSYQVVNPRYNELKKAINDLSVSIMSKESYIQILCNKVNDAIRTIVELNISDMSNSEDIGDIFSDIELEDFNIASEDAVFLEGEELSKFITDNNIPAEGTAVQKTSSIINGVSFPVYYVYDTTLLSEGREKFIQFGKDTLQYASLIEGGVLQYVRNSGTGFIFEQTVDCDGLSKSIGKQYGAAYYNPATTNIVIFNPSEDWMHDYQVKTIIHETGHAYDFALASNNEKVGGYVISEATPQISIPGIFTTNPSTNQPYSWSAIIEHEGSNLFPDADLQSCKLEYFAEVFSNYYSSSESRDRLAFLAPDSYAAMKNLTTNSINGGN